MCRINYEENLMFSSKKGLGLTEEFSLAILKILNSHITHNFLRINANLALICLTLFKGAEFT